MPTLRCSTYPASTRPCRNAETASSNAPGDPLLRNPTTGIAACCARAASGDAATAPPRSVMNSRRLIGRPQGQNHAPHRLTAVRVLERGKGDANCDQLFRAGNVGSGSHERGQNRKTSESQMFSGFPRKRTSLPILELPPPPVLHKPCHGGLACRLVAMRWPTVFVMAEGQR